MTKRKITTKSQGRHLVNGTSPGNSRPFHFFVKGQKKCLCGFTERPDDNPKHYEDNRHDHPANCLECRELLERKRRVTE